MRKPRIMISEVDATNAFAYVSPFSGVTVAITTGLLELLEDGEMEAVIGHELGHLKHRDVMMMMAMAFFPMLLYIIARGLLEGAASADDEGGLALFVAGLIGLLVYFLSELGVLALSRVREYYADRYSASIVDDGARKLSAALVKIVLSTRRGERKLAANGFKALLISDPDANVRDGFLLSPEAPDTELISELKTRRMRARDWLCEALSTHPNITNRLRNLDAPPLELSPEWREINERWAESKQLLKHLSVGLKPPKEIVAIVEESMKKKAAVDRFILMLYNNAKAEMEKLRG
jgi:heat shock protein HtpX